MADKPWKRDERKVAQFFRTERNPLSGRNSKHTASDTLDERLFIENKRRKSHAVMSVLRSTASLAKAEGKIPVVCLTEHKVPGFGILIYSGDLFRFAGTLSGTRLLYKKRDQ